MNTPTEDHGKYRGQNFAMSLENFRDIAAIAYRESGIALSDSKIAMVRSRLTRRLRALKMQDFDEYIKLVKSPDGHLEVGHLVSALTTNVSHFFRENHHFALLKDKILPRLLERARAGGRVRIWSAGCSNGQEPYSIAMTILALDPTASARDIRILATDIDPIVLKTARAGIYSGALMTGLENHHISAFFERVNNTAEPSYRANEDLRKMVTFRELNLHHRWPMNGTFDVIFCRNVVIYFDVPTQTVLYQNFARVLAADGWLILGHSERISDGALSLFEGAGLTTYRPIGAARQHAEANKTRLTGKGAR